MKFFDLIHKHTWESIQVTFFEIYPKQERNRRGYSLAYDELSVTPAMVESPMRIGILHIDSVDGGYESVYGLLPEDSDRYALDFIAWEEILQMEIQAETLQQYSEPEIIAHILYDITFNGYSSETVKEAAEKILK